MDRLLDINQYKELFKTYRQFIREGVSNNYLSVLDVDRYIKLQRIFYETQDECVIFFTDEEEYYEAHYMGAHLGRKRIEPKDKPILVRYVYTDYSIVEKWKLCLSDLGLKKEDTSVQIVAKISAIDGIEDKLNRSIKYISRFGLSIQYASRDMYEEMFYLRGLEPLLSKFHFHYETKEEILDEIDKGYYRVVKNKNNEIVAAQHFVVNNGTISGEWLAVKEEYKLQYGIGGLMAYHSFMYAKEHGIDLYYGWVDTRNTNSLKYHHSVEYKDTQKMTDGWVMEAKYE